MWSSVFYQRVLRDGPLFFPGGGGGGGGGGGVKRKSPNKLFADIKKINCLQEDAAGKMTQKKLFVLEKNCYPPPPAKV